MNKVREHKHRLEKDLYRGRIIVAFTICVLNKKRVLASNDIFNNLEEMLCASLDRYECSAHVYLFMPEHGHFLIEGKSDSSDLWRCTVDFKQRSGYWFSKNNFQFRWQKDFYDHILRRDEDVIKQVRYILENPVRKGLVSSWCEYSFKGSTVYNLDEVDW